MMFKTRFEKMVLLVGMFMCVAAVLAPVCFADVPAGVNIRGQLLDVQGQALPGVREFTVQFYDAATGGTPLGDVILGQIEVSPEGLFNIPVILPPQALLAPEAWYEVAVASGPVPGPLTGADVFPERVKLESVPFALEALDVTHVDVASIGSGLVQDGEFDFLSGVTSGIQGQLDAKANAADVYTKGEVDSSQAGQDTVIAAKANAADVYTIGEVDIQQSVQDTAIADKVAKAGDTMTGALTVNDSFVGIGQAAAPGTPADKLYNVGGTLYWNGQQVIAGGSAGFPWTAVTANTQMAKNNGYIANSANLLTLTLPLSANINVGDTIRVAGLGAGGWKIAQNASQSILTGPMEIPDYSGPWTERAVANDWIATAASADGRVIVAAEYGDSGGSLYTSWDYGVTWVDRSMNQWWYGLAASADGSKLVGVTGGYIYTSWDSGATWTQRGTSTSWRACAASADGTRMVATWNTDLYVSTDSGVTWTSKLAAWDGWGEVAMSADGMKIACCTTADYGGGYCVHISKDGGETFDYRLGLPISYGDIAMSADGARIAACAYGGQIWISADTGATWIARESARNWRAIAMSADGTKLAAHDLNGYVYFSTDSGVTWTPVSVPRNIDNHGLVMSADGTRVVFGQWGGQIYTLNTNGAIVAQTPAGTAGYISGEHYSAVELQYEGSNTFRVLTHEKARPYQTVTQPELALGLAAKANASDLVTHTHDTAYWRTGGNAGTTPGTHYVGTSDNQALELKVNGARALRLEPAAQSPNVIGGYSGNSVAPGVSGATISGGGVAGGPNTVTFNYGTVGGGFNNTASGYLSTVAGGSVNTASNECSTVGGGYSNLSSNQYSTVAGGNDNTASGTGSAVAGGYSNTASGNSATVGGGQSNTASGNGSFAAGVNAKASRNYSFVWADGNLTENDANNQFVARATGGFKFYTGTGVIGVYLPAGGISWLPLSDRNKKENFEPINPVDVLEKVAAMPVTTWTVIGGDPTLRYMGPMAQDFYAAFGLGNDETRISTIDADGVALAAIQGLNLKVEEQAAIIDEQATELITLHSQVSTLQSEMAELRALVEQLAAE